MVAPITGPFSSTYSSNVDGSGSYARTSVGYRQKPPYTLPLQHSRSVALTLSISGSSPNPGFGQMGNANAHRGNRAAHSQFNDTGLPHASRAVTRATNSARAVLISKLGDRAGIGINLAQYAQSRDMVVKAAKSIYDFGVAVRHHRHIDHFELDRFTDALGLKLYDPRVRKIERAWRTRGVTKQAANRWLEWSFGWAPIFDDLHKSMRFLASDVEPKRIKGSGRAEEVATDNYYYVDRNDLFYQRWYYAHTFRARTSVGARVSIVNPNTVILNHLGLYNPAVVAWDAVPWSFVVDWGLNISQLLSSYTDLAGYSVTGAYTQQSLEDSCSSNSWSGYLPTSWRPATDSGWDMSSYGRSMSRQLTIPDVKLEFRNPFSDLKIGKALTASALLIQNGIVGK